MAKLSATPFNKAVNSDKRLDSLLFRLLKGTYLATFVKKVQAVTYTPPPISELKEALEALERDCKVFPSWENLFLLNTDNLADTLKSYANSEQHLLMVATERQKAWAVVSEKKQADETVEA